MVEPVKFWFWLNQFHTIPAGYAKESSEFNYNIEMFSSSTPLVNNIILMARLRLQRLEKMQGA